MRVVDSIMDRTLHKLLMIEDNKEFAVLQQAANRRPKPLAEHMSASVAKSFWRNMCYGMFYAVSHNDKDANAMADARVAAFE